ncbi:hypothetical protein HDG34_005876 [Paraburkholderia sp. HC6.4b]|uniref:DUF1833 family protein n=1 Tax=unclassified Paraburkholderia TaxID=2615204 RepID=UPI00161951B4|nr:MULTISPECIES: DUF1833 family protein [unclassified Paraburkholderia]MBB5411910.1 hypothetical protein [Paraburkholderia sp. HC6.4b]MBB5450222.1 hypothetical protein [Paraburkholderia sp. Kb1A]
MQTELQRLLASQQAGIIELETFQVSHPNFSRSYYIVRNLPDGFTGQLEDGSLVEFQYVPVSFERAAANGDLDYEIRITFQDLNEIIAPEVARIPVDSKVIPTCIVRSFIYRRDGTISPVADGPFVLGINSIAYTPEGCAFTASSQPLNVSATGEVYAIVDIPMLKGFVIQ